MNKPVARIEPTSWEVTRGFSYILTADDVFEGKNKLGMDVSHIPLNVPLCHGCDEPIPPHGACAGCEVVHADIAADGLTECVGDPLLSLELERLAWRDK